MDKIAAQWKSFQELPFPEGVAGEEIEGEDLVSLDTFAAGCISTFVGSNGKLDFEKRNILNACITGMRKVIPRLPDEARHYYQELLLLSLNVEGKLK